MIALGTWPERPSACSKNASADAVSRWSPQQHVHDLTVLVHSAVQVPLVRAAKKEHLVGVPVATERATVLASFSRQLRPECLNPAQHGAVGHVDAPFGQQLHYARAGQWVAQVPAHGHQDHVGWPTVAREGRGGPQREVASAVCAAEAPATIAVMAVTRDDELLAVRTGG